ncbi:MAG: OsmC family peroxiredoxin, partial [Actinobacteria bacterium]|nr:OsmC family peroxiredoxin [Actinomycetota bacterium]NIU68281.1 OsmC family peroxiredoxin [Actinomycetota bacterium]NIW30096.1 OsmC family peroxiredoxin [Actinomycetota bacterium]
MSENGELTVSLELIDEYRFNVSFERAGVDLLMDEPEPLGDGA